MPTADPKIHKVSITGTNSVESDYALGQKVFQSGFMSRSDFPRATLDLDNDVTAIVEFEEPVPISKLNEVLERFDMSIDTADLYRSSQGIILSPSQPDTDDTEYLAVAFYQQPELDY